ncbi:hypothetical protein QOZ80_3AG0241870 [Eleusine coracana subsp. coracana]|nr:hypothetical protein QOZ80_3AG0241870 [Eleusine coracana subsp. coracana]
MDPLETLPVRFHLNGEFCTVGNMMQYVGGKEAMSHIERDKVSYPEILGHLRDHMKIAEGTMLHWQFPGLSVSNGLRILYDDKSALEMADSIVEGGAVDIYVEDPRGQKKKLDEFYSSPTKRVAEVYEVSSQASKELVEVSSEARKNKKSNDVVKKGKEVVICSTTMASKQVEEVFDPSSKQQETDAEEEDTNSESGSSESDYIPGDVASSKEDGEATDILKKFKAFKKKMKKGQTTNLDDVVLEEETSMPSGFVGLEDEGNETPYFESDDEESMDEMGSDGEVRRKPAGHQRFKKTKGVPKFCLGMKFSSKKDFKKAVIRYALAERKVVNFVKDDPKRETVQEEMFANVSISKLKKAKAMVIQKELDSNKEMSKLVVVLDGCSSQTSRRVSWMLSKNGHHKLEHRNCARHIYANWKKYFRNKEWQKKFWKCAKAPCLMMFNLARAKLAKETSEGAQAILNTHPQHWSRAWFSQHSVSNSRKRKTSEGLSQTMSESSTHSQSQCSSATINVHATVPTSQATSSVTIKNGGRATARVCTTSPPNKKITTKKPRPGGMMLLPPWHSDKL